LAATLKANVDRQGCGVATWAPPRWASPSAVLLSAGGLGVSGYLTVAHYAAGVTLACPDTGTVNCEKVTTSPESVVFGIPVALLGVVFFAALLALNLPPAWRRPYRRLRLARLSLAVSGIGFAVYLIYTELFTVHAICLWCTSAHAIAFLLFVVTLFGETMARPPGAQIGHPQQARRT
jgi:uncharacterized membrane protein